MFDVRGRIGWQEEKGAERKPFHNFTATAEAPLGDLFVLNVEGGRSNSNLASPSGFKQNRWAAYVTTRF
jgi:hypothetical protein